MVKGKSENPDSLINLTQTKYLLREVFTRQKVLEDIGKLVLEFHNSLYRSLKDGKIIWASRTHIRGITYLVAENKAFMMLDVRQKHISILFFTGDRTINGLEKGNWHMAGDMQGSKRSIIAHERDIDRNIEFAHNAIEIADKWTFQVVISSIIYEFLLWIVL